MFHGTVSVQDGQGQWYSQRPHEWSDDARYIVDLLKRVVRVRMETLRIVEKLPSWER